MNYILRDNVDNGRYRFLGVFSNLRLAVEAARKVFTEGYEDYGVYDRKGGRWIRPGKRQHLEIHVLSLLDMLSIERLEPAFYKDSTGDEIFYGVEYTDSASDELREETKALGGAFRRGQ